MSDIASNLIDSYRNYFTEIGEAISSVKDDGNNAKDRVISVALKAMGLLCLYWGVSGAIGFVASLPILSLLVVIELMCSIFTFVIGHDIAIFGKNILEQIVDPTVAGAFQDEVQRGDASWYSLGFGAGWYARWNGIDVDQTVGREYYRDTIILKYLL